MLEKRKACAFEDFSRLVSLGNFADAFGRFLRGGGGGRLEGIEGEF